MRAVAQLVERLFLRRSLNPNIGKVLSTNCKLNGKDENKEKEAGNDPFKKTCALVVLPSESATSLNEARWKDLQEVF